jgi:hypothetical protein
MSVDGVLAHQQRDSQPVLGRQVHSTIQFFTQDVQDRTGLAGVDEGQVIWPRVPNHQLPDFLLQSHTAEQVGHAFFDA